MPDIRITCRIVDNLSVLVVLLFQLRFPSSSTVLSCCHGELPTRRSSIAICRYDSTCRIARCVSSLSLFLLLFSSLSSSHDPSLPPVYFSSSIYLSISSSFRSSSVGLKSVCRDQSVCTRWYREIHLSCGNYP